MAVSYFLTPWGAQVADLEADPFDVPAEWTVATKAQYDARVALIQADKPGWKAKVKADGKAAKKAVYDNLKASAHTKDWTDATIQAVAGYTPEVSA